MSAAVADFARAQYTSFVATPAGPELSKPELSKPELSEPESDLVEKILNMDEEVFRRLFNMPKVTEDVLQSEDREIDELD
jgi:hypothetical protein